MKYSSCVDVPQGVAQEQTLQRKGFLHTHTQFSKMILYVETKTKPKKKHDTQISVTHIIV